jgi:hypothetical protein
MEPRVKPEHVAIFFIIPQLRRIRAALRGPTFGDPNTQYAKHIKAKAFKESN